jgi:hypothetical protein
MEQSRGGLAGGKGRMPVDYQWLNLVDDRGGAPSGRAYGRYLRQMLGSKQRRPLRKDMAGNADLRARFEALTITINSKL